MGGSIKSIPACLAVVFVHLLTSHMAQIHIVAVGWLTGGSSFMMDGSKIQKEANPPSWTRGGPRAS